MAKIIGALITENKKVGNEKDPVILNRVEFRVVVRETSADGIGEDVAKYIVKIEDFRSVFEKDPRDYGSVRALCESLMNRECFLETKAGVFEGKLTQRIVHAVFLDELVKSGK